MNPLRGLSLVILGSAAFSLGHRRGFFIEPSDLIQTERPMEVVP
jgi:hypothetical protein